MKGVQLGVWAIVMLVVGANPVGALPGQTTDEAAAWIQANPTLRPRTGEKFLVTKSDSAAQRFTFEASLLPPGRIKSSPNARIIRSEKLTLFDVQNGVTQNRLQESLRAIYGLEIFQDFDRAQPIYTYPSEATIQQAIAQGNPLVAALQGELRRGKLYAYWLEVAQTPEGLAYSGRVTVFLRADLDKIEAELRNR
ncbi:MAG: hypothetical protein HC780_06130 [Leptolyngbyaceae cyanobacterium CSU_1_3]|nr:hypothetical protein [Leptolyngbyaceae cyanobacterium CSU_1_3]